MRIVNRKEFLALPENTMFRNYQPHEFGYLSIKLGTIGNDFYYISLDDIECDGDVEMDKILSKAQKDSSFVFKTDFEISGRDGFFDRDQLFAVYSNEEMIELGRLLLKWGGTK